MYTFFDIPSMCLIPQFNYLQAIALNNLMQENNKKGTQKKISISKMLGKTKENRNTLVQLPFLKTLSSNRIRIL